MKADLKNAETYFQCGADFGFGNALYAIATGNAGFQCFNIVQRIPKRPAAALQSVPSPVRSMLHSDVYSPEWTYMMYITLCLKWKLGNLFAANLL